MHYVMLCLMHYVMHYAMHYAMHYVIHYGMHHGIHYGMHYAMHYDLVGPLLHELQLVRGDDNRAAQRGDGEVLQGLGHQVLRHVHIDGAQRVVQQQQAWPAVQRARQRQPRLLPA